MAEKYLIHVVDDDPKILKLVRFHLETRGYRVREDANGTDAITSMLVELPDLLIVDLALPGSRSGRDVTRWLRQRSDIPIIVLSANHLESVKVLALDAGADDYVTKPFSPEEFMARVRAGLRRVEGASAQRRPSQNIYIDDLTIDLRGRRALVEGRDIRLTRTEFALLAELVQQTDAVLSHDELLMRVWGREYVGSSHYLHVYFGRIRKKLGQRYGSRLASVPGFGYVLHSEPEV